jgi:hypothetical protein
VTEHLAEPNPRALFVRDVFRQFFDARRSFLEILERCVIKGWPDRKAAVRVNFRLQELFYACETLRLDHLVNHSSSNQAAWGSYVSLSNVHERLNKGWGDLDEATLKNNDSAYAAMQTEIEALRPLIDPAALEEPFRMAGRDPELLTATQDLEGKSRELNQQLALSVTPREGA